MTAKELLKMLNEASDTAEIKVVDGEITITEPKVVEYKFKVGDKVMFTRGIYKCVIFDVVGQSVSESGEPLYNLKNEGSSTLGYERFLALYVPQSITERIKTFEDACKWCAENGYCHLTKEYEHVNTDRLMSADVIAYAKLRIITAALNEEWFPEEGTNHAYPIFYSTKNAFSFGSSNLDGYITNSKMLVFKTQELAKYAAKQFADIYADFCGFPKSWAKWKPTMDKLNK